MSGVYRRTARGSAVLGVVFLLLGASGSGARDPDTKINYKQDRKKEISVPGVVNPDDPVGILQDEKGKPPLTTPTPYGLDGDTRKGMPLAGTFYGRSGTMREKALREGGGTKETEAAVALGLKWIARQQLPNGSWPLDGGTFKDRGQANDIAGTAFGLLPLLGGGYSHKKARNGTDNPFDKAIEKGLGFLIRKQDKKTGNFGGGMYAHAMATIAVCEAYGLSQDPALRHPARMAADYLIAAQHEAGGWRYGPQQAGDTSVTGWAVMALKTAQMANLDVPERTMKNAVRFLDSCCNTTTEGYGYTSPGGSPTLSAVGLLCRQYLQHWGANNLRLRKGVENNLATQPPGGSKNMYYHYYATQVLHHLGGDSWKKWNEQMRDVLLKSQEKNPSDNADTVGSWSSAGDVHGSAGGRLMTTSLSLLTLEVYYRHLPLYYRDQFPKNKIDP